MLDVIRADVVDLAVAGCFAQEPLDVGLPGIATGADGEARAADETAGRGARQWMEDRDPRV